MAFCSICGAKASIPTSLSIKDFVTGKAVRSIEVCPSCARDMRNLRSGDFEAHDRISRHLISTNNDGIRLFFEEWKNLPDEEKVNEQTEKARQEALKQMEEARQEALRKEAERKEALAKMLISSGFSFEGHRIVKYSGYISGDDVTQIPRSGIFGSDNGKKLTDALVRIRQNALRELKEAAYDLGCNAIIGVDFDYITLEPETANFTGGTLYEPYLICVTANGNAVIIEKE